MGSGIQQSCKSSNTHIRFYPIQEKNEVTQEIINTEEDAVETLTNSNENGTIATLIKFDEVNSIRKN